MSTFEQYSQIMKANTLWNFIYYCTWVSYPYPYL